MLQGKDRRVGSIAKNAAGKISHGQQAD